MRVKDLPARDRTYRTVEDVDGSTYTVQGRPVFLHCPRCGAEYSATRGDYFAADPDQIIRCTGDDGARHRAINMRLVRRVSELVEVDPATL
jgi:uncharacterized C2H2 Zn-finger protein